MSLRAAFAIAALSVIVLASSAMATGSRHKPPSNPVPEPTTMAALALGAGWAVNKLRKRSE